MPNQDQEKQIRSGKGFIAALDQSGGSTPKALLVYGIDADGYSNDTQMYDLIHAMRSRIASADAFIGEKVLGAILFENTMGRAMGGKPSAEFLWKNRGVVPFLKVDKGLVEAQDGVQLMKPMGDLDGLLHQAMQGGIFGAKMRSVIGGASKNGIAAIVEQQFDIGAQIAAHGLVPIIEPEITINIADKAQAEEMLRDTILMRLNALPDGQNVMLKLTLPEQANLYKPLALHPRVMSMVALSGGYTRDEANKRLAKNTAMIASFSRALTEGLSAQQSDAEFNTVIAETIDSIYRASIAG